MAVVGLAIVGLAIVGLRVWALGRPTGCAGRRVRGLRPVAGRTRTARTLTRRSAIRRGPVGGRVALRGTVRLVVGTGAIPVGRLALLRRGRRTLRRGPPLGRRSLIAIRRRLTLGPSRAGPILRPAVRTVRLLIPPVLLPVLLPLRLAVLPVRRRGTGRRRLRPALGRALPRRRFGLRLALGGRFGPLARGRRRPLRPGFWPLARGRWARRRAGTLLRRPLGARAAVRGFAAAGAALLRSALRHLDPARRGVCELHERQARQHRAGEEDQAEQAHRGLVSVQAEPNTGRRVWFRARRRETGLRG
ncbi:hypothetical protein SAMN04488144_10486 [Methylobacterium sp. 190mf]|nr:hypothetical protein SAMN04488144_10486 [Methylobacterium sp. 190mf]